MPPPAIPGAHTLGGMSRYLLFLIAIGQFAAGGLPRALGLGQGLAARAESGGIPAELPLGLFFAIIWNVIFRW